MTLKPHILTNAYSFHRVWVHYMLNYICSSVPQAVIFSFSYLQGRATGNKPALWLRSKIQSTLFQWGSKIQKNNGIFLLVGIIVLSVLTFSLKSAMLETRVEKLWVEGKF